MQCLRVFLGIVGLALMVLQPVDLVSQTVSAKVPTLDPGIYDKALALPGSKVLRYGLYIPKDYTSGKPAPLVLALHYGGAPNGAGMGVLRILVEPALADLGAVIVAPETLGGAWDNADNERAVMALMDATESAYSIDPNKVVVTGFSMGGAGTWHFAEKFPDRFTAAVPVAGRPPASVQGWEMPVFAVHSRNDEVMPIAPTEARMKQLQQAGVHSEFVVLTGISHYQTNAFVPGLRRAVPWLKDLWK